MPRCTVVPNDGPAMSRRHHKVEALEEQPLLDTGRSWSTRLAWATLMTGAVVFVTRLSVATVVSIHGDGMAPTLLDGDHVLLVRGTWSVDPGDVVVYEPLPLDLDDLDTPPAPKDAPQADNADGRTYPDARQEPAGDFRNVAVIDPDELQDNWKKVQRRSGGIVAHQTAPLRLGRVLAKPGDRVAFHVPGAALGIAVEGTPLFRKSGDPVRVLLVEGDGPEGTTLRPTAWESSGDRRWQVLAPHRPGPPGWIPLRLPPASGGPVEVEAPGYLIVADNRDDGACCDSRALGWIPADAIRGRVMVRLAGNPSAQAQDATERRGVQWGP